MHSSAAIRRHCVPCTAIAAAESRMYFIIQYMSLILSTIREHTFYDVLLFARSLAIFIIFYLPEHFFFFVRFSQLAYICLLLAYTYFANWNRFHAFICKWVLINIWIFFSRFASDICAAMAQIVAIFMPTVYESECVLTARGHYK